jgi:hypothetical protein
MQRFKDYSNFVAWHAGLAYLLLWAVTFWTLDEGTLVFGKSGCYPDSAKVLFYWVCEAGSPIGILASISNAALTATVWAPVFLAAASVQPYPDAAAIAALIIAVHVIGLPLGILAVIRMLAAAFDWRSRLDDRGHRRAPLAQAPGHVADAAAAPAAPEPASIQQIMPPRPLQKVRPRGQFGLRS